MAAMDRQSSLRALIALGIAMMAMPATASLPTATEQEAPLPLLSRSELESVFLDSVDTAAGPLHEDRQVASEVEAQISPEAHHGVRQLEMAFLQEVPALSLLMPSGMAESATEKTVQTAGNLAVDYAEVKLVAAVAGSGVRIQRHKHVGDAFDDYVAATKLRKLDDAGQLLRTRGGEGSLGRLPTPDVPGKKFVLPDYTILNPQGKVAAFADAKSGQIAYDAQARGFVEWAKTLESKRFIYYVPRETEVPKRLLDYAEQRKVTINVIVVP